MERRREAHEKARRELRRDERWRVCGVPALHAERHELHGNRWQQTYETLCDGMGGGLWALLGSRGTGKTQLAVELLRYVVERDGVGRYVRAMDFFASVRGAFDVRGKSEIDALQPYTRPDLLVIDEAHMRGHSQWEDNELAHLVDVRYGEKRDTILISNQQWHTFRESIGSNIASRLEEVGGVVVCDWESYRKRGKQ